MWYRRSPIPCGDLALRLQRFRSCKTHISVYPTGGLICLWKKSAFTGTRVNEQWKDGYRWSVCHIEPLCGVTNMTCAFYPS